jgi:hypothetical protein
MHNANVPSISTASTLQMDVTDFSETSVYFCEATRLYIPAIGRLQIEVGVPGQEQSNRSETFGHSAANISALKLIM